MRRGQPNAVEQRRRQVARQLDHLHTRLATKTRKDYRSESRYRYWQKRYRELVEELEGELSVLDDPGEYAELPLAVCADELGISVGQVKLLIDTGELTASGQSPHQRVERQELERAAEIGPSELLRRAGQDASEILEEAISHLKDNNLVLADLAYRRIRSRDPYPRFSELALRAALQIVKGRYQEAFSTLENINRMGSAERAVIITNLRRILKDTQIPKGDAVVVVNRLLAKIDHDRIINLELSGDDNERLQESAKYLSSVIQRAVDRFRPGLLNERESERLVQIIMDAIYTGMFASATYGESAASKNFVDSINLIKMRRRARLLGYLLRAV